VSELGATLQVLFWFGVLGLALICAGLVLAGRQPARRLEVFLLAGVALQFLPLGQPPLPVQLGAVLTLAYLAFGRRGRFIHWIQGSHPPPAGDQTVLKGASS
jgi:hypothetical protein